MTTYDRITFFAIMMSCSVITSWVLHNIIDNYTLYLISCLFSGWGIGRLFNKHEQSIMNMICKYTS